MKTAITLMLSAALLLATATVPALSAESHTLPVIVKVNAKGKVTDIAPAYQVSPGFQKLVRNTLERMITKPAMRDGKPVSSQFVVTLGVIRHDGSQGKTGVSLKYLGSKPLPPGSWYWTRKPPSEKLALVNQNAQFFKNRTQDTNQLLNAMRNQQALDMRNGVNTMSTPSVGTGH